MLRWQRRGDAVQIICKLKEVLHMRLDIWVCNIFRGVMTLNVVIVTFVLHTRSTRIWQLDVARFFSYPAFSFCWLRQFVHHPSQVCRQTRAPPQAGLLKLMRQADCFVSDRLVQYTCASSSFGGAAKAPWPHAWLCRSAIIVRGKRECVVPQHYRAVCPTALRVCGKFEITEGPSRVFDGIKSDLTDATNRLWVWYSTPFSPLQSYIVTPHQCIVRWASPLGWACSFGQCVWAE